MTKHAKRFELKQFCPKGHTDFIGRPEVYKDLKDGSIYYMDTESFHFDTDGKVVYSLYENPNNLHSYIGDFRMVCFRPIILSPMVATTEIMNENNYSVPSVKFGQLCWADESCEFDSNGITFNRYYDDENGSKYLGEFAIHYFKKESQDILVEEMEYFVDKDYPFLARHIITACNERIEENKNGILEYYEPRDEVYYKLMKTINADLSRYDLNGFYKIRRKDDYVYLVKVNY